MISYRTLVIDIDRDGFMTVTGTYSATTRKHIGYFLKEYAPRWNYYDAKNAYTDGYKLNIYTGEIIMIE